MTSKTLLDQPVDPQRQQPARSVSSDLRPIRTPRMIIPRMAILVIMAMWMLAGYGKIRDLSAFVDIISAHRVLPQSMYGLVWWIGPAEILLGLTLIFVMGSELRKFFGKFVLFISMSSILGFTYYLSLVPDEILRESGCGCLDSLKRVDLGIDGGERMVKYAINALLVALHLLALFGPRMIDRSHRARLKAHELEQS